jgi:hypothetical protein
MIVNTAKQQCPTMALESPQHGCDASTAVDATLASTGFAASGPAGEYSVSVGLVRDNPRLLPWSSAHVWSALRGRGVRRPGGACRPGRLRWRQSITTDVESCRRLQSPADDSRPVARCFRGSVGTSRSSLVGFRFPPEVIKRFAGTCANAFPTATWKNRSIVDHVSVPVGAAVHTRCSSTRHDPADTPLVTDGSSSNLPGDLLHAGDSTGEGHPRSHRAEELA